MKVHDMPSWMELGVPPDDRPPEPLCNAQQVLDVLFGRRHFDGHGRDYEAIVTETAMACWADNLNADPDAAQALFEFIGRHEHEAPEIVLKLLQNLAEAAANEEPTPWK